VIPFLDESKLAVEKEERELLKLWIDHPNAQSEILYRGTIDGFASNVFHEKCDD